MLRFEITSLWHPDGFGSWQPLGVVKPLRDFSGGKVTVPKGGQRIGEVTISLDDPVAQYAKAYAYMLRAFYFDEIDPVLWGAITLAERDTQQGTVRISAVDRSNSLVAHFLRKGDQALNSATDFDLPNEWDRQVPANGAGIQMIIDAAQNLPGHQANTYPPLGITYAYDDTDALPDDTKQKVKFQRGDEVWQSGTDLTAQEGSSEVGLPDIELAPVASVPGVYARLHVFKTQGDYDPLRDRHFTTPLEIHAGWGKDNADVIIREGGTLVTHTHVLSSDTKKRVTRANSLAAAIYGVYVNWDQSSWSANDVKQLKLRGDATLAVGSHPVPEIDITPKTEWDYRFLRDYIVGSQTHVVAHRGYMDEEYTARIVEVTLAQADQAANTSEQITVLPNISFDPDGIDLVDSDFTGTDDGVIRTPIDAGFDWAWGSSGTKRLWYPTTNGVLIAKDTGSPDPYLYEEPLVDFTEVGNRYGIAVLGANMALASRAYSYPGYNGISYSTVGTTPNRVFVVTFDLPFAFGDPAIGQHITAQAQLHEDGTIELHYQAFDLDPADALSALTVGIWWRDSTSTDRTLLATIAGHTYDNAWPASAVPDGQAVRFTPSGDTWAQAACTFNWIDTAERTEDF